MDIHRYNTETFHKNSPQFFISLIQNWYKTLGENCIKLLILVNILKIERMQVVLSRPTAVTPVVTAILMASGTSILTATLTIPVVTILLIRSLSDPTPSSIQWKEAPYKNATVYFTGWFHGSMKRWYRIHLSPSHPDPLFLRYP